MKVDYSYDENAKKFERSSEHRMTCQYFLTNCSTPLDRRLNPHWIPPIRNGIWGIKWSRDAEWSNSWHQYA